ncbi:uncharacterized protein LOC110682790 [Chenopodium quinoa]|uniref:uncharacterized protein LOC110682790 n=1 Tax=Chenopodium quinoa TaxID=63459 RepID=UPI000B78C982|nr:uncharacterized protein LOC110682790 [Chenopodium quinoa]
MAWDDDIDNADHYIVYYEAVIEAGLRFPLYTGIRKILKGYDLGVWQLTPNLWVNILSYITACELQNISPSFSAFAHMHYLSKAPGGHGAWYTLSTLPQYLMSLDKVSKWSGWKDKFYLISSPTLRHNRTLRWYYTEPTLLGRKCPLPELSNKAREQIMEPGLFETTTEPMGDGTHIIVPKNWIPHPDYFKDECFLSACGLSLMFPKADALKMVDPAKTPAKSAALLRKEAAIARKAAIKAKESKKGGDSVKRVPRSFSKLFKRQGEDLGLRLRRPLERTLPGQPLLPKPVVPRPVANPLLQ